MNIIWSEKINLTQILLGLKNHPNTNTNIIRFENIDRIRIRIFWYSNIIQIIFEYRIIRSPLVWNKYCRHVLCHIFVGK